jgi:hypothetical protein
MNKFSTDSKSQCARFLAYLLTSPCTTIQARKELDIMNPSARVQELKAAGYDIISTPTTCDSGKAKHSRVARYVLLSGGDHE